MPHQELPTPSDPAPRFSPGRVLSAMLLVLVAAGTFAAIWFFPWPAPPKKAADTQWTPERIREMKRKAGKAVEELERADDGEAKK